MEPKNKRKNNYGVFAGLLFVLVFYVTLGYVASFLVMKSVAEQIHSSITPFDNWWQILLFVVDLLAILGIVFCIIMRFKKKEKQPKIAQVTAEKSNAHKEIINDSQTVAQVVKKPITNNDPQLESLKKLYETGILTKEEYEQKIKLLNSKKTNSEELIKKLLSLYQAGILSKEEYEAKRKEIR